MQLYGSHRWLLLGLTALGHSSVLITESFGCSYDTGKDLAFVMFHQSYCQCVTNICTNDIKSSGSLDGQGTYALRSTTDGGAEIRP